MINNSKIINLPITLLPNCQGENFSTENLFPQENFAKRLPSDIIEHILRNFIAFPASNQMMKLNRSWHVLFNTNPNLYLNKVLIPSCLNLATCYALKGAERQVKYENLLNIVKIDPQHDFSVLKNSVKNLGDTSDLSRYINGEIALLEMKITKKGLSPEYKNKKNFSQRRIQAKEAKLEAKAGNFKKALELAKPLIRTDSSYYLKVLSTIAKYNLSEALNEANKIKPSLLQVRAFIEISINDPNHELTDAKRAVDSLEDSYQRALAFIQLAKVDFEYGLNGAKELLKNLPDEFRIKILSQLAAIDQQSLIHYKKAVLANAPNLRLVSDLMNIVHVEIPVDLVQAKESILLIQNKTYQHTLYENIIEREAQSDVEKAEETLKSIENYRGYRAEQHILKAKIKLNCSKMKETILQEQNPRIKSNNLLEVVKIEVQEDIKLAIQTAASIPDTEIRAQAYIEIAQFALSLI